MKNSISLFSSARDVTVNGGRLYAIGGNFVQGIGKYRVVMHHKTYDEWAQNPAKWRICLQTWYVIWASEVPGALTYGQRETVAQTIDRRLEEMIGRLQLPPIISTGFVYVMDATGQRYMLTMDMTHSFEVCSYVKYGMIFILHLLKFPAIQCSS